MEKLIELINIVNRNKIKSIEVLGKSSHSNTLLSKLYDAVHDQKITSEEEALAFLYGKTPNKKAYYKLKSTLKDRLLNTLFLIDVKEKRYSDRNKVYLESQKGMMALNFIVNAGIARKTAVWLAEKLLKTAVPLRFANVAISAARILRGFHASKSGNRKKFEKYDQIVIVFQELYAAELMVESLYSDLISYYVTDKSTKLFIYDLADKHIKAINKLNPKIKSAKFYYQKAMLEIAKYMSINDYQKTKILCINTLDNLNSLDYQDNKAIVAINYQLIVCYIHLKKYEEGKKQIDIILSIQDPETFNWFKAYELYMSLCFHTYQYEEAWRIYRKISKNKKFKHLPNSVKEIWRLYESWLYFLNKTGNISPQLIEQVPVKKFRVSRFINEMNIYSKDKKGLNIPILIIYTVLLIEQKKYALLVGRIEALAKYVDRYIKRKNNMRSNYFIRMLLEIPKNDFQYLAIKSKSKKYLSELKKIPIDLSNQSHDVELLPYEVIWDLLMELLNKRRG